MRFLHLFSGPTGRSDGLASFIRRAGHECEEWDIVNGEKFDLADDATYQQLKSRILNEEFDGCMLGPPCHTFSNARREDDGGPRPLRTASARGIYGRADIKPEEKEDLRLGTLLALRAVEVFGLFVNQHKPALLEQPARRPELGAISMFDLPEFKTMLSTEGVVCSRIAQCNYGADTEKPTEVMHFAVDLSDCMSTCEHPKTWWRLPSSGASIYSAHTPLKGKEAYVPADSWDSSMRLSYKAAKIKYSGGRLSRAAERVLRHKARGCSAV